MNAIQQPVVGRRALLTGAAGLAVAAVSGLAAAPAFAVPRPSIISCGTWGAAPAKRSISMTGPPTRIIVHHTASPNVTDYSVAAAHRIARNIQSWHFDNGWIDSGQQFTISRGGYALEGRHRSIEGLGTGRNFPLGSHVGGHNSTSIGIENEGTYTSSLPTTAQWNKLVDLCAYLCQTYGLKASAIYGHRDFNSTACPGNALYAQLPALRAEVAAKLGQNPPPPPPPTRSWPVLKVGANGYRVTAAQYLLRHSGRSLTVDGDFGNGTKGAVEAFQNARGLEPDGVIGRLTWEKPLAVTTRRGDSSNAVRAVQTCLRAKGRSVTVDGVFGEGTEAAVEAFQKAQGLLDDGIVGLDTWSRLLS